MEVLSPLNTLALFLCERDDDAAAAAIAALPAAELDTLSGDFTPLTLAAYHGSEAAVRALLLRGAAVNTVDSDHCTALMLACLYGHVACVRRLLASNAAVDNGDQRGNTALLLASVRGHTACAALVLEAGAEVDTAELLYGHTALFYACKDGHLELAQLLSSYRAERDFISGGTAESTAHAYGNSALHAWLVTSRGWATLHHINTLTFERCKNHLADGADALESPDEVEGVPTPYQLAEKMEEAAKAAAASAAQPAAAFAEAFGGTAAAFLLLHVRGYESEDKALLPKIGRQRADILGRLGRGKSPLPWSRDVNLTARLWDKLVVPRVLAAEYGVLPLFLYRPCEVDHKQLLHPGPT